MTDVVRNPDLNRDNVNTVIARIRKNKEFVFNMSTWGNPTVDENGKFIDGEGEVIDEHTCGTAACIAGFCVVVKNDDKIPPYAAAFDTGMNFLGLERSQARRLFMPEYDNEGRHFNADSGCYPYEATADQGIKVLEHLRDTGEVDWRVAWPDYHNDREPNEFCVVGGTYDTNGYW
jgi:hypothetical protein